jgi:hypothetical protein
MSSSVDDEELQPVLEKLEKWINKEKPGKISVESMKKVLKGMKDSSSSPSGSATKASKTNGVDTKDDDTKISDSKNQKKTKKKKGCQYKFIKGDRKGKLCGKAVISGSVFCKGCRDKGGAKSESSKPSSKKGKKGKDSKSKKDGSDEEDEEENFSEIDVYKIAGKIGIFWYKKYGFIVKPETKDGSMTVIGHANNASGEYKRLTPKQRDFALEKKFNVPDVFVDEDAISDATDETNGTNGANDSVESDSEPEERTKSSKGKKNQSDSDSDEPSVKNGKKSKGKNSSNSSSEDESELSEKIIDDDEDGGSDDAGANSGDDKPLKKLSKD